MDLQSEAISVSGPVYLGRHPDDPAAIFGLLDVGRVAGTPGTLLTIVGIEGGAPRSLGAQMAVLADGQYCGYVSGGCVETAIATEALAVRERGADTVLRIGMNSPFVDIRLPCGGGIDLHVHVDIEPSVIEEALEKLLDRAPFTLGLSPDAGRAEIIDENRTLQVSAWEDGVFHRRYTPVTRLVLIGRGIELESLARVGYAAGLDVIAFSPEEANLKNISGYGAATRHMKTPSRIPLLPADPWTAIVFLFHDHDWETILLEQALETDAFYVGALGSRRTHERRCISLVAAGVPARGIERIRAPVGLFGPTRDASTLSLSILAEISEERRKLETR